MAEPSLDITMVQDASAQIFLPDSHAGMTYTLIQGLSHAFPTSFPFSFIHNPILAGGVAPSADSHS